MTIKCTAIFGYASIEKRAGGWTESYYHDSTQFGLATTAFERLCRLRASLLATGSLIRGQRYTIMTQPFPNQSKGTVFEGNKGNQDVPQMALHFMCRASSGNERQLTIRGLPDARVEGGEYNPSVEFDNAITQFKNELTAGWQFHGRVLTQPLVSLVSITAGGVYTTATDFTVNAGQNVRFFRSYDTAGNPLKDLYPVSAPITARSGVLGNWPGNTLIRGKMRVALEDYFAITSVEQGRIVVRKVGRPFFQYSGRASVRR